MVVEFVDVILDSLDVGWKVGQLLVEVDDHGAHINMDGLVDGFEEKWPTPNIIDQKLFLFEVEGLV